MHDQKQITAVGYGVSSGGSEVGRILFDWYFKKAMLMATWREHWLGRLQAGRQVSQHC